jgi:Fic family protein
VARLQRLALAHIEAERELEATLDKTSSPLSAAFIQQAHAALYGRLAPDRPASQRTASHLAGAMAHVAGGR